jgi:hypothetical protein
MCCIRLRLTNSMIQSTTVASVEIAQTDNGIGPHIQSGRAKALSVNGTLKRTMQ